MESVLPPIMDKLKHEQRFFYAIQLIIEISQ